VGNNTSINRVYDLSSELSNFTGIVTFSYQDSELNNILEANLVLEVMDANDVWTSVAPNVDASNNNLTYDFTGIVEISKVTASDASSTLTITSETLNSFVRVYPNPTTEKLFIVSKTSQKASLFNVAGQKLLDSNATELDVTDLPSGIYLLNLQNTQNQISTFKIIKK
jgi:hypothetical protein